MSDRPLSARSHHPLASASRPKLPLAATQLDRRIGSRQQRSTRTVALNSVDQDAVAASLRPDLNYTDAPGSYAVGEGYFINNNLPTGDVFRNFLTFRLPRLQRGESIVGATLQLTRFTSSAGDPVETFGLFDVSTPAGVLRNATTNVANPSIFEDLGTGRSYGTYNISTIGNSFDLVSLRLNRTAVNSLNRSQRRSFSIGGSITSLNDTATTRAENLFTLGNFSGTVRLVLRIRRP